MGEVYRAKDTMLGREVAVKVLPEALARDPERLARLKREAKVLASLNHPNIAQIYGVESQALVMELVEGEAPTGPLPVETALNYARQIAEALEAAHEKGIVHRDVKPANIMVTRAGVVKVLDFGLATSVEEPSAASDPADSPTETLSRTRAGVIRGTAAYMSPEQARGATADKRADIWAFGVVLYEMLSGKRAFPGQSVTDVLAGVLRAEPDWSALPAATPSRIRKLLLRCLERDCKQRLQAIGEARIAIDAPEQDVRPVPAGGRLWPWAAAALAMALAVTAAAGWWRASRPAALNPPMRLRLEMGPDTKLERPHGGSFLALSPDGTLLAAIVSGADGETRLATRRLDQSQTTLLAGTEDASSPFFSPDGQWIAFHADRKIKKISVRGGAAVTLCDAAGAIAGSWGDDGNIIVPLGWGTGLSRISSSGGAPAPVTELSHEKDEFRHAWPQVLPGSRAVLFTAAHTAQAFDDADIDIVSLKTGVRTTLHHGGFFGRYLPSGHLVWVHQNTLYAAPFDLASRVTLLPGLNQYPVWTPDGKNLLFWSSNPAAPGIYGVRADGSGVAQRLTDGKTREMPESISPDGKRLAISEANTGSGVEVRMAPIEGDAGHPRLGRAEPFLRTPFVTIEPAFSPDGRWLAYFSGEPGKEGLWVAPFPGPGGGWLVSSRGGSPIC